MAEQRYLRSKHKRNLLWLSTQGKCAYCGVDLISGWHADHVTPWKSRQETNVFGMQPLCSHCNYLKGGKMLLRKHQQELVEQLNKPTINMGIKTKLVAHVTPGGGKSGLAVLAANLLKRKGKIDKVAWLVPKDTLREQAADSFRDDRWRKLLQHEYQIVEACNEACLDKGHFGYATTYAAICADSSKINAAYFRQYRTLLIADEVHHVALDSTTHKGMQEIYDLAAFRLIMTGSLDRHDGQRIAFLEYRAPDNTKAIEYPDVDIYYGRKEGLLEKALIRTEYHLQDGCAAWLDKNGDRNSIESLSQMDDDDSSALFAALQTDYANQLLKKCYQHWTKWRKNHPHSLMLVVCMNQAHAREVTKQLKELGHNPDECKIAIHDGSKAAKTAINGFKDGNPTVLVTVQMASEGLDVPAITHLACLTRIRSKQWLDQMFGRGTRFHSAAGPWEQQCFFAFCPDDPLMAKVIEYRRSEEPIGVAPILEEDEGESAFGSGSGSGSGSGDSEATVVEGQSNASLIVPLSGQVTRNRAWCDEAKGDLEYNTTMRLQEVMEHNNLHASVTQFASALTELGFSLSSLSVAKTSPTIAIEANATTEVQALRRWINKWCVWLDEQEGVEYGTWNGRSKKAVQSNKTREELTHDELITTWKWVAAQVASMRNRKGLHQQSGDEC